MTLKVVIDMSSIVSASLRPLSIPDQALTHALAHCELCTSEDHLEELEEVVRRKRFNAYVDLDSRLLFLSILRKRAMLFAVPDAALMEVQGSCRDGDDEFLLALAMVAKADVIVSSDRDLLVMHPWRGISIVTPAEFLDQVSSQGRIRR